MLTSCQKEILTDETLSSNTTFTSTQGAGGASLRGEGECMPGEYTVAEGMFHFEDITQYKQTLVFLSCATTEEKQAWRNSLSIETPMIAYRNFLDAICCEQIFFKLIDEFEQSVSSDPDLEIIYHPDNGLNGKVSSFSDF